MPQHCFTRRSIQISFWIIKFDIGDSRGLTLFTLTDNTLRSFAMKILVTGGTGKVGSEVIKELVKRSVSVRALVRKQEASTTLPEGVEVFLGDLLDPVAVRKALDGVDKLYLLNAVVPDELTQELIAYDLAKKLKLKQIVYHSVFKVEEFKDVPHFASNRLRKK
jgi:uncharacterized protein YbjT (DUF2867 family)